MFLVTDFDRDSIMKYDLHAWMFQSGARSHCFTGRRNSELSEIDKATVARAYPSDPEEIKKINQAIDALNRLKHESAAPANQ